MVFNCLCGGKISPPTALSHPISARTYVHAKVHDVVVAAYHALELAAPGKIFVYGETGWKFGGRFRPHRTHQKWTFCRLHGSCVDEDGRSIPLPTGFANRFGYGLEFDGDGKYMNYTIDFESIAEHFYQLHIAAKTEGIRLESSNI